MESKQFVESPVYSLVKEGNKLCRPIPVVTGLLLQGEVILTSVNNGR